MSKYRFAIDRGGTFTDVFASTPRGPKVLKLLSRDPANYQDAPTEGIRRVLAECENIDIPRGSPVPTAKIASVRMGTTVATNALLERQGERVALVTTQGFRDLLKIGTQARPEIFDLEIKRPSMLYEHVVEIDERVVLENEYAEASASASNSHERAKGIAGENLVIEQAPNKAAVISQLKPLLDKGIKSLAIVFLHSYTYPAHETVVAGWARDLGFEQVSLSSEVLPMVRAVPRGHTAAVDAYLTPVLRRYLHGFKSGFESLESVEVSFMQSDGGLTPVDTFRGHNAIVSGPAGGVVGYATTAYHRTGWKQAVIGFDMGGTSTDVSRYSGEYDHVFESEVAGVTLMAPMLAINTVAAGGGSRLFYRSAGGGVFAVGPESAGAHPGPVCYRKGGPLAVTDANVQLGRIHPQHFPKIFGKSEDQPVDFQAVHVAFDKMAKEVNATAQGPPKTADEVAAGFLDVAVEAMARPIRNLTIMKGLDVTQHVLAPFGGAGPQFACSVAKSLGMSRIHISRQSGILSAVGIALADVVVEKQEPCQTILVDESKRPPKDTHAHLENRLRELKNGAVDKLLRDNTTLSQSDVEVLMFLNLRFLGTDTSFMTHASLPFDINATLSAFEQRYKREFGFVLTNKKVVVDDIRIRAIGKAAADVMSVNKSGGTTSSTTANAAGDIKAIDTVSIYFNGKRIDTPVFNTPDVVDGVCNTAIKLPGPCLILQGISTVVIEPGWIASVITSGQACGDLELTLAPRHGSPTADLGLSSSQASRGISEKLDPVHLAIFGHRFMGIAESMGRTLQRTATSVNIKERLDFSCALFDSAGGLVANAPHIPVHLGAMQEAVRFQIKYWLGKDGPGLTEGDVLVSNHPQLAGGSHLPDINVFTPVFVDVSSGSGNEPPKKEIVFWVASRGHHADVGGIAPGSMPPLSKALSEEGTAITAFKLVKTGSFQEEGISKILIDGGTRRLADNISDLKAQVAANQQGVQLMAELCKEYGLSVVKSYMHHIQQNAEASVKAMLIELTKNLNPSKVKYFLSS